MARYHLDGRIYDTTRAATSWEEDTRSDGSNQISVATGSQWDHEALHESARGTYWVERWSQWQGSDNSARVLTDAEATIWLTMNDHPLPDRLENVAADIIE
jgi:hypothetical protein